MTYKIYTGCWIKYDSAKKKHTQTHTRTVFFSQIFVSVKCESLIFKGQLFDTNHRARKSDKAGGGPVWWQEVKIMAKSLLKTLLTYIYIIFPNGK
jgi:hypothetical protein